MVALRRRLMNRFNNNYYDYSNLISTDTHENMDTFIDISAFPYDFCRNHTKRECRSGFRQFVRSDTWKEFLQSLNRIPGYLSTGYQV